MSGLAHGVAAADTTAHDNFGIDAAQLVGPASGQRSSSGQIAAIARMFIRVICKSGM
ncbi:MAG: hypothetical protein ACR2LU_07050 [Luteitalea sp.]